MVTETLNRLIEIGYQNDCKELEALVSRRLTVNADDILKGYLKTERSYVDDYCSANGIDQWVVMDNKQAMIDLGTALITSDIKHRTFRKAEQDKEFAALKLGITPISLTNGIETKSKWMRFLDGPKHLRWVNRKLNDFLAIKGADPSVVEELEAAKVFIGENYISPDTLRPDINKYWDAIEYPMSDECEAFLLKYSGK